MFQYTLHVPSPSLEAKTDGVILRRAARGHNILSFLFLSSHILKVNSDTLSDLLANQRLKLPKNSTRKAKIQALMQAPNIRESVSEEILKDIQRQLEEEDISRKKKHRLEDPTSEDIDEEQDTWLKYVLQIRSLSTPNQICMSERRKPRSSSTRIQQSMLAIGCWRTWRRKATWTRKEQATRRPLQ